MAGRRKWVQKYDLETGKYRMVEVDLSTYRPRVRSMSFTDRLISESHYEGAKALDGTPIDSRSRHKRYMEEQGVCHAGDFSEAWYKNRRAEIARENARERRESIAPIVTRAEE